MQGPAWLLAAVALAGLAATSADTVNNRTKRQAGAEHCDPAYCQIPVSGGRSEGPSVASLYVKGTGR